MNFLKINLDDIRIRESVAPTKKGKIPKYFLFLKGPVSWKWLCKAARLPGKALHVSIGLKFLAGLNKSETISLSGKVLKNLGVTRHSSYRALRKLEDAGLVSVDRHFGRNPIVTILEIDEVEDESK